MKFLLEILPLAAFFLSYQQAGLMIATLILIIATTLSVTILYIIDRKIPLNPLISALLVGIFGGLTLYLNDPLFIKLKPTIINCLFAAILFIGVAIGKPPLKYLMGMALPLTDRGWRLLSLRWGIFFIGLALLNEYIWRHYSEEFWVNFKVFGMLPLTLIFLITQLPMIQRETPADSQ
jgi:intracellular septation protein